MASSNTNRKAPKSSNDLYNTPLSALEAAWEAGIFNDFDIYYDPCDGLGAISDFIEGKGKTVYRSDIVNYRPGVMVKDFFDVTKDDLAKLGWWDSTICFVFNPPFKQTERFIDQALSLSPNLIMFNRAAVLETHDRSVKHHQGEWRLKKFWSFANRQSCTEGVQQLKTSNSVWYGWFRYDQYYTGQPKMDWLFATK